METIKDSFDIGFDKNDHLVFNNVPKDLQSPEMIKSYQETLVSHENNKVTMDNNKKEVILSYAPAVLSGIDTLTFLVKAIVEYLKNNSNYEENKITLDDFEKMSPHDIVNWFHEVSSIDLENICKSDDDIKKVFDIVIDALGTTFTDGIEWKKTSKGFQEFFTNHWEKYKTMKETK